MKKRNKLFLFLIIIIIATAFTSCVNSTTKDEINILADTSLKPLLTDIEKAYEKSNKNIDLVITYGSFEEISDILQNNKNEFLVISHKNRLRFFMDGYNCSYEREVVDFAKNIEYKISDNDHKIATIYSAGIIDTNYELKYKAFINRIKLESPNYDKTIANIKSFLEYLKDENNQEIYNKHGLTIKEEVEVSKGKIINNILSNEESTLEVYVNVYLPPDYSEDAKPYKVVYFQDGDFYQTLKNTYDRLISEKETEPFIAVFIQLRKAKYGRNQSLNNNQEFTNFNGNNIVKFIRENYNVSEKPEDNVAAGLSLGAFQSISLAYKFPDVFKGVISQSVGLGIDSAAYYFKNSEITDINFYIENGQFGDTMPSMLIAAEYLKDRGVKHVCSYFIGDHSYFYWQYTLEKALVYFFGDSGL